MTPLQPTQAVGISLEAQEWNVVLGALGDAPWRIANPLIQKIVGQIEATQGASSSIPAQRSNGADDHAPH